MCSITITKFYFEGEKIAKEKNNFNCEENDGLEPYNCEILQNNIFVYLNKAKCLDSILKKIKFHE